MKERRAKHSQPHLGYLGFLHQGGERASLVIINNSGSWIQGISECGEFSKGTVKGWIMQCGGITPCLKPDHIQSRGMDYVDTKE